MESQFFDSFLPLQIMENKLDKSFLVLWHFKTSQEKVAQVDCFAASNLIHFSVLDFKPFVSTA